MAGETVPRTLTTLLQSSQEPPESCRDLRPAKPDLYRVVGRLRGSSLTVEEVGGRGQSSLGPERNSRERRLRDDFESYPIRVFHDQRGLTSPMVPEAPDGDVSTTKHVSCFGELYVTGVSWTDVGTLHSSRPSSVVDVESLLI